MFTLTGKDGAFNSIQLKERVDPARIESFCCLQNTNLQPLRTQMKGHAVMILVSKVWRLCFLWSIFKKKVCYLLWLGETINGFPSFFFLTQGDITSNFSKHFKFVEAETVPSPAFFVNLVPPSSLQAPPTGLLRVEKSFLNINSIDKKLECIGLIPMKY